MKKRLSVTAAILFLVTSFIFSQELSYEKKIRFPIWAQVDAYPGLVPAEVLQKGKENGETVELSELEKELGNHSREEEVELSNDDNPFSYAAWEIHNLTPFLMNAFVYGWHFTYVPSDKLRGVEEYFEVEPVMDFSMDKGRIKYESSWFEEEKVHTWVSYERTPQQIIYWKQWQNIKNPRILGTGTGRLSKGFEGIREAADNALKDAVREHFRKILRNKPKEISGTVLLNKMPAMFIDSGHYKLELDFFLETDRIIEYSQF